MTMAINSIPTFKGMSRTENGTPYHKANGGLWVGGTYAALQGVSTLKSGKPTLGNILLGAAGLGCGLLVDNIRNNNAKEAADQIATYGTQKAMLLNHDIKLTDSNTPYYKSKDGAKNGALLGMGCGVLALGSTVLDKNFKEAVWKKLPNGTTKAGSIIFAGLFALPLGAFGGWLMGKITDHFNNKAARNASIEQAHQQMTFNA